MRGRKGIELNLKEHLKYLGKAVLTAIQYSAPDRAEFFNFTTTPNDFGYGLMGQVSILESLNLHVDEGQQAQADIKGRVSDL